jgi:MFS family permease
MPCKELSLQGFFLPISIMVNRFKNTFSFLPRQFWLIVIGVLVSSAGSSLIWPFQLVYVSGKLGTNLTTTATLITISSFCGLCISYLGGSIADRFGRKPIMFMAQIVHGLAYILMSQATVYIGFLVPMALMGIAMPFYSIGSDAMVADMVDHDKLPSAFTILRMANNAGIAIGPAIGGFLISKSYELAFYSASAAMVAYGLLLLIFSRETLKSSNIESESLLQIIKGYKQVFRDRRYISFIFSVTLGMIAPLIMWTLLAVYTKVNYNLPEAQYAWLPVTNALMCVFIQYFVTQCSRKYPSEYMIALGMLVYALGVGSVALMSNFAGFLISMIILTFGELILIPTATAYAAGRAPGNFRGRYMSIYWLTWGLARAIAPLIGGTLNDAITPKAIWYGGFLFGLTSAIILLIQSKVLFPRKINT